MQWCTHMCAVCCAPGWATATYGAGKGPRAAAVGEPQAVPHGTAFASGICSLCAEARVHRPQADQVMRDACMEEQTLHGGQ